MHVRLSFGLRSLLRKACATTGLQEQANGAPAMTRIGTRMQGREGVHAEAVPGAGGGAAGQGARAEHQRCGAPSRLSSQGSTGIGLHSACRWRRGGLMGRAASGKQRMQDAWHASRGFNGSCTLQWPSTRKACERRLQWQRSVCRACMERSGCGARPVFGGCRGHAASGRACCDGGQAEAGAAEVFVMT